MFKNKLSGLKDFNQKQKVRINNLKIDLRNLIKVLNDYEKTNQKAEMNEILISFSDLKDSILTDLKDLEL